LAALLVTYQDRHKLRMPRAIIERWAPKVETDTTAYVAAVARRIGVGPDDAIDLDRPDHLRPLVEAIIHNECAGLGGHRLGAGSMCLGLKARRLLHGEGCAQGLDIVVNGARKNSRKFKGRPNPIPVGGPGRMDTVRALALSEPQPMAELAAGAGRHAGRNRAPAGSRGHGVGAQARDETPFGGAGLDPSWQPRRRSDAFLHTEAAHWAEVVRRTGATADRSTKEALCLPRRASLSSCPTIVPRRWQAMPATP